MYQKNMTDEELVRQANAGDEQAVSLLYSRYVRPLHRFFWYQFHDNAVAEDLTQDTCIAMIRSLSSFSFKGSFRNWLYAIAKYQALHYLRDKYTMPEESLPDWLPEQENDLLSEDVVQQQEANQKRLHDILQTLSAEDRKLVTMNKIEGKTSQEIAAVTGMTPTLVRVRIHRILSKIRKHIHA